MQARKRDEVAQQPNRVPQQTHDANSWRRNGRCWRSPTVTPRSPGLQVWDCFEFCCCARWPTPSFGDMYFSGCGRLNVPIGGCYMGGGRLTTLTWVETIRGGCELLDRTGEWPDRCRHGTAIYLPRLEFPDGIADMLVRRQQVCCICGFWRRRCASSAQKLFLRGGANGRSYLLDGLATRRHLSRAARPAFWCWPGAPRAVVRRVRVRRIARLMTWKKTARHIFDYGGQQSGGRDAIIAYHQTRS